MKKIRMDDIKELRIECPLHHEFEVFHATPLDDGAKSRNPAAKGLWLVEFDCGYTYTQDTAAT